MQDEGVFRWVGNALGEILRSLVDAVGFIFGKVGAAVHEFFAGVAGAMGIDPSFLNIVWIVLGVWMLFSAIRAFARRHIFAGIVWLFLVSLLFGLLMSTPAEASRPAVRSKSSLPAGTRVVPLARPPVQTHLHPPAIAEPRSALPENGQRHHPALPVVRTL